MLGGGWELAVNIDFILAIVGEEDFMVEVLV